MLFMKIIYSPGSLEFGGGNKDAWSSLDCAPSHNSSPFYLLWGGCPWADVPLRRSPRAAQLSQRPFSCFGADPQPHQPFRLLASTPCPYMGSTALAGSTPSAPPRSCRT